MTSPVPVVPAGEVDAQVGDDGAVEILHDGLVVLRIVPPNLAGDAATDHVDRRQAAQLALRVLAIRLDQAVSRI